MRKALKGMPGHSLKLRVWQPPETMDYGDDIGRIFAHALGDHGLILEPLPITSGPRTGILEEFGGDPFAGAVESALRCLVPGGAPDINRGSTDPNRQVKCSFSLIHLVEPDKVAQKHLTERSIQAQHRIEADFRQ